MSDMEKKLLCVKYLITLQIQYLHDLRVMFDVFCCVCFNLRCGLIEFPPHVTQGKIGVMK